MFVRQITKIQGTENILGALDLGAYVKEEKKFHALQSQYPPKLDALKGGKEEKI